MLFCMAICLSFINWEDIFYIWVSLVINNTIKTVIRSIINASHQYIKSIIEKFMKNMKRVCHVEKKTLNMYW